jgi:predicted ATPase
MVIVGDPVGAGAASESIVGDAPNLAARLALSARVDTVAIEPATRRLIGNLFDCRELGAIGTTGAGEPIRSWQVLAQSAVTSRFEALRGSALSTLIGRDEEIDLLLRRWARAKTGVGQVVLLSGEPGIGKSRIITEFEERIRAEAHLYLRYFCSPHHQDSGLFPFIDQLSRAAGFTLEDGPAAKMEKLGILLARATPPEEDVAFLAALMSLPASRRHQVPELSPQRKKEKTLQALIRQLEGLVRQQPVVVVFEDAHWIDPTSRELLDLTVERVPSLRALLVVTFRPEFQQPWAGQPQVTMLALNRLERRDRTVLVSEIAGGKALPDEVIVQIADHSDGVPLFIEELTKNVLESDVLREEADRYVLQHALPPFAIPPTLHASLLARLDRLPSVRHVAQIGAAIGRQFSYALLCAVSGLPADELQATLARLVASGLVFERGFPPEAVYTFKHALVQDAAHGSLLRKARQQLHAAIAEALETHYPELLASQPEHFARHYAEAGLIEKSVTFWGKAGHCSATRSAMAEAAAQFQKALDQLALLPDDPKRQRWELELLSALGAALRFAKGFAALETGHAYARARELWERLDFPSEFRGVPDGQSAYHMSRGELELALRSDEDFLRRSHEHADSAGLILSHHSFGRNLMLAGRLASSRSHLEAALAVYGSASDRELANQVGTHPHVNSQAYLGNVLLCLGYTAQALDRSRAAVAEARRLAHPPSLANALVLHNLFLSLIGDDAALDERTDELVVLATDQSFPLLRAQGMIFRGWSKTKNGDVMEGISLLRGGLAAHGATGTALLKPYYIGLLAAACEMAYQVDESLSLLGDALQIIDRTGERWFEAELHRHRGQLLLRRGHSEAAEELYSKALSIARGQEAKLWELRAAMSLTRLRRDQGLLAEARDLLAPLYSWFTEGFGAPDLKEATGLLKALEP